MNSKSIIALVVMALVVVVVAIPILSGVHFYESETNADPDARYSVYTGETLEFAFTDGALSVNGEPYALQSLFLISDTCSIGTSIVVNFASNTAVAWADGDTLTVSRGAVTGTGSMASLSFNLGSDAIYYDADGNLGRYLSSAYINQNTKVYSIYTNAPSMFAVGNVVDGLSVLHSANITGTTVTDMPITSITMDTTETEEGAFLVNAISFVQGSANPANSFIIVPVEYQVESDGGTTGQIVDVIPVLLVISLLVFAALAFLRRA